MQKCVLRYLWHFEWIYEPWLVSSVIYDGAKDKIDISMDYLWEHYFPESQEIILKHKRAQAKAEALAEQKRAAEEASMIDDQQETSSTDDDWQEQEISEIDDDQEAWHHKAVPKLTE